MTVSGDMFACHAEGDAAGIQHLGWPQMLVLLRLGNPGSGELGGPKEPVRKVVGRPGMVCG